MKIYCSCCDKVQPVVIDECRDANTDVPFQDIVCAECWLVIASGTDIRLAQPEQEPVAWMHNYIEGNVIAHRPADIDRYPERWTALYPDSKPMPKMAIPDDWKIVPRNATPEMLKAMDECAQEGYDERLYAGIASSVYMAAWDASPVLGTLPSSEKKNSMMDMIVGNLVREGINKHRARELAEHFIKQCNYTNGYCTGRNALLAEQKAQQPVATLWQHGETGRTRITMPGDITDCDARWFKAADLYTTPPQRTWVGLTDEDKQTAFDDTQEGGGFWEFADAIEAKLKEKNT